MKNANLFAIVVAAVVAHNGVAQEIKDTLPTPPEGKTWNLVWHDEFDGTKLDDTKWEVMPDAPAQRRLVDRARPSPWTARAILVISIAQGRRPVHRRLRADEGQVRAFLRLLRRPRSTAEAARALVGVLDHGRRREQGRQRWP